MTKATSRHSVLPIALPFLLPLGVWSLTVALMGGPRSDGRVDLAGGRETFRTRCASCHFAIEGIRGHHGPNLHNIGKLAASRKPGSTAAEYILESIVDPSAFVSPMSRPGMPRNTIMGLGQAEIRNLIAFVASRGAVPNYDEIISLDIPDVTDDETQNVEVSLGQMVQAEQIMRDKGRCLECHSVHNRPEYKVFAPGLFGVGLMDPELIRESIIHPNKVVSPVYKSVNVLLTSGNVVRGKRLFQTDEELTLLIVDAQNYTERRVIPLEEVEEEDGKLQILESRQSTMPAGFDELLNEDEMKAVVALIRQLNE